ncbi:MAG: hypothetical protein IPG08_16800 [Sphingobacteriaceae bacterium]|nr:hypothetical protein [Sphingobacteriaceae bacterium]
MSKLNRYTKLSVIFFLLINFTIAQNPRAVKYFDAGVVEFNLHNYPKADTLFTWSIKTQPSQEAYYNRALCRINAGNKEGYCNDLAASLKLKAKVEHLYWTHCGKADTSYIDKDRLPAGKENYEYLEISYFNYYNNLERVYVHNKQGKVIAMYKMEDSLGNVYTFSTKNPDFTKNHKDLYWFESKNKKYPKEFYDRNKSYKVAVRFIVNEDATLSDLKIQHIENDSCYACDVEAVNYVKKLSISPGTFNDKPVKFSL